jgi:tRNA A-37 threonylcarbamoyl transferase component Bud32
MSDWLGKMLGKVRIDSLLARGGIAEVYLGEHVALQREVAIKILRNQFEDDPQLLERFQREARVVAKLRHSNIVQVFDFDSTEDGRPYLVMEYVPGVSLSRYLHALHGKNGRLELPVIERIITQVAHALQFAHESGVIHRDVKPGNILLTSRTEKVMAGKPLPGDFEPILTDFGLVRFLNSSRQTTTGVIAGTPAYMSPEQARGEPTDERTDIYSLGIVLYELLAGHIPFDGETTMSIILKHVTEPPPPIPGIPYLMQQVLNRALAKKTEERFQTANDLANAFSSCIEAISDSDTLIDTAPKETTHITTIGYKEKSKPRNRLASIVVLGAVALFLSGFLFYRGIFSPAVATMTPTVAPSLFATATMTNTIEPTFTPVPIPLGVLHFQDNTSILDLASMSALDMLPPPDGSHYEVWLTGGGLWRSIGILQLDGGKGELILQDNKGLNLLSAYDQVVVTVELDPDTDKKPSDTIAYAAIYPSEGLIHLRQMLVISRDTPKNIALVQGLNKDIELVDQSARAMQSAYQKGNETGTKQNAEAILNLMTGDQSENHKDWNSDKKITDPSDGFGLLPNGKKAGYIQTLSTYVDQTVNSDRATEHMNQHGAEVKTCAQNLTEWTAQLWDLAMTIVTSPAGTDLSEPVLDSVQLADQLLNGLDTNNDKSIDAVAGECGMSSLYGYAYSMADLTLLKYDPATFIPTETSTPTVSPVSGNGNGNDSGNGSTSGNTPSAPKATKKPPPGQQDRPTKTPRNSKP